MADDGQDVGSFSVERRECMTKSERCSCGEPHNMCAWPHCTSKDRCPPEPQRGPQTAFHAGSGGIDPEKAPEPSLPHKKAGKSRSFVERELRDRAALFASRNEEYGDDYKRFGKLMSLLLKGQTIDANDEEMMTRLGVFVHLVAKVSRYGRNFTKGGHSDSLDDISVYAMMQKEVDNYGEE